MTLMLTTNALGLAGLLLGLAACSGENDPALGPAGTGATAPGAPSPSSGGPSTSAGGAGVAGDGVANYDRPLGMPIGQGPSGSESPPAGTSEQPDESAEANQEVEIPVFEPMDQSPPCSGCVELNVDVNDINQRDNFVFAGGGMSATRVVWTIIVPFNSDQLFVQPFVDNSYGTFTDLDANAFPLNAPAEIPQDVPSIAAGTVGLAIGSSGAWTGNMTMSVFVDAVTIEGAAAGASRTFDTDLQGLVVGSNTHNARIVYHPPAP